MTRTLLSERARLVAQRAHDGQRDRDGQEHIAHVLRVAGRLILAARPDECVTVAYLHDVLEDTGVTAEDLLAEGFPIGVVGAVKLLTRRPEVPYAEYVQAIAEARGPAGEHARFVKMADLQDNLERSLGSGSEHRAKRYRYAIKLLEERAATPLA